MGQQLHSPKDSDSDDLSRPRSRPITKHDLRELERLILMTQAELAAGLKALQAQVGKIGNEQSARFDAAQAKIAELEELIKAGGTITQEVVDAFDGVKVAMQTLDDAIPDPVPTP